MAERGHSEESIKASIEARKPDFDAYIDPQKKKADVIIQVKTCTAELRFWLAAHDRSEARTCPAPTGGAVIAVFQQTGSRRTVPQVRRAHWSPCNL